MSINFVNCHTKTPSQKSSNLVLAFSTIEVFREPSHRLPRHLLVALLEGCELTHEGSRDVSIDLTVKKHWTLRIPQ